MGKEARKEGFGGDAEVMMGEERWSGWAEIAQGLAYSGLRQRPSGLCKTGEIAESSGRN
jgi:hypothetical protein